MILSMTGFGEARGEADGVSYRVEIRSVNNRYFKLSLKMPELFQRFEGRLDKQLRGRIGRGTVNFMLRISDDQASAYEINKTALARYAAILREVVDGGDMARIDLASLLSIPGVCQSPDIDESKLEAQFAAVQSLTATAIDQLVEMRTIEGKALLRDLQVQGAELLSRLGRIETRAPGVVTDYAERLDTRLKQLLANSSVDLERDSLAREVAIFADRCDINEEIARMKSHMDQFTALCDAPDDAGRKLEFLAQELLREANTIGSKANDAEIASHVVEIKAAIDRLKEQVQNVA